jgi:anaerobic magnesium-protoporphyrin IX monomethyl ester cyclase
MARIVFPYSDFENLGIEYLMSSLEQHGHETELVFYNSFDTYINKQFQTNNNQLANKIEALEPDYVAFSCVTDNYQKQLELAKTIKNTKIVFGGPHVTSVPEKVIKEECVDAVIIGEGEISFNEYINKHKSGQAIPGVIYKHNGRLIGKKGLSPLPDLNKIPFPKKIFPNHLPETKDEYRIITSRGCPFNCAYCFNSYLHKLNGTSHFRQRSVDNVIKELELAKEKQDPKYVLFVDDCFTANKEWILNFCKEYKDKINLPFACISHVTYLNEDVIVALREANCWNVQIGIESTDEHLCKNVLNRHLDLEKAAEVIKLFRKNKIMVQADHLLGVPGDTTKNQEHAIKFYNECRPSLISIFWLTYYPKTAITNYALQKKVISHDDIERLERGFKLSEKSYLIGGDAQTPEEFYAVAFLLNWLPLIPKWKVNFLLKSKLYKIFKIKNFYLSTALPRAIQSLFNKKDFRGRSHLKRFFKLK